MIRFELPPDKVFRSAVLGIGVFDGVHLGHRKIIRELAKMGQRIGAVPVAVTFMPHPREILGIPPLPRLLLPPDERFRRLREAGAEVIGVIEFSRQLAETSPGEFVEKLLELQPTVRGICVGSQWRFGRRGDGDTAFLAADLKKRNIAFDAVPEVQIDGSLVSSSLIREKIAAGRLDEAAVMLDAPPALYGEVVPGFQIAERALHAPTANLRLEYGILPPDGVYAGMTTLEDKLFPAVTNIGFSPTFGDSGIRRIETHIVGFSGDLYGRKLVVELFEKIRDEQKFSSVPALKKQIRSDCDKTIGIFAVRSAK